MFLLFTYSFPGINKASIRNYFLVVSHEGRLYFRMTIGRVDHVVDWVPNGFTLSKEILSLKLCGSLAKFGHLVSMCAQAFELGSC